jgi:hypothetical protein
MRSSFDTPGSSARRKFIKMKKLIYIATLTVIIMLLPSCRRTKFAGNQTVEENSSIDWKICSLIEGANDNLAQCATVLLPLFYDSEDPRVTPIYVKRLRARSGTTRGQLWLLHGGPGASGVEEFGGLMSKIAEI